MSAPADFDAADEALLLDAIDRWIERDLAPIVKEYDHADRYPEHVVEQMKELGLFGATIGRDYGGLGLPARTYALLVMRISAVWMSVTGIFNTHLMLAHAIEKFGTDAQKNEWLPKLASGEIRGGVALTEPEAGTDLQGIRTIARRDGDDYVINGAKTWITNAAEGSCVALLVLVPDAAPAPTSLAGGLFALMWAMIALKGAGIGKLKPGSAVGLCVSWTRQSRLAWDKGHRTLGRVLFWGGLIGLATCLAVNPLVTLAMWLATVTLAVTAALFESWRTWRIDPDRRGGHAA